MTANFCLGIHYSNSGITAALVEKRGSRSKLDHVFKISPPAEDPDQENNSLIDQLAQQLATLRSKTTPVALALAGEFYQSQFHQSEFSDNRMLRQTLRFDVEEDFSTDAESFALCYQRVNSRQSGARLIVHTLDKQKIQGLLDQFEQARLDALVAEPDIVAWTHYINDLKNLPSDQPLLAIAWTAGVLYLLALDRKLQPVLARSCICSSPGQLDDILFTELRRCLALLEPDQQPRQIFYHPQGFSQNQIARLQKDLNLPCLPFKEPDAATAIAGGAALGWLNHQTTTDFRSDGMTPKTVVAAQHKAFYGFSAALTALMLSVCFLMNSYARKCDNRITQAQQQLTQAWIDTRQERAIPKRGDGLINTTSVKTKLQRDSQNLSDQARRQTTSSLPNSVSNTMLIALQTLDTLPETFKLRIEKLHVTDENAVLTGIVPNLDEQKNLHQAFIDNPLWANFTYDSNSTPEGTRFTLSVPLNKNVVQK